DVARGLARDVFDGFERSARARRLVAGAHTRGTGAHHDDVDGVTDGIMEVTRDPRSFLGEGETAFTLDLLFSARSTKLEFGDLLTPQPRSLTREPGDAECEAPVQQLDAGEAVVAECARRQVSGEEGDDHSGVAVCPGVRAVAARRPQEQCDR